MEIDRRAAVGSGLATVVGLSALSKGSAIAAEPAPRPIRPLRIKGLVIGEGRPKVIVSIAEATPAAALSRAGKLAGMFEVDLIEYRIDHLADRGDADRIAASVDEVAGACDAKPLLMTFRTKAEGGEAEIAPTAYARLYSAALRRRGPALIDLQYALCSEASVAAVLGQAKAIGCPVMLSYHNFQSTPTVEAMIAKLRAMQTLGADVPKIAVMPHNSGDTIKLLQATWEMYRKYADRPILTMAMAGLGAVSRIAGETFGSALTFGSVDSASAPGQVEVSELRPMLDALSGTSSKDHRA